MYRLKIVFKYLKAIWNFIIRNQSLKNALYEISVSKYVFGNKYFKDFIKNENIISKLEIAQNTIDRATRLLDNKSTEESVKYINAQKDGPFKDIKAKLHNNRHGASNHGISLGLDTKISGVPVQFGVGFDDNKKIKIGFGPLSMKF